MTPWPLSVEMDAAVLVYVPYDHVCSPATPIRPIRPHTKDLLYGLCLLGVSGHNAASSCDEETGSVQTCADFCHGSTNCKYGLWCGM